MSKTDEPKALNYKDLSDVSDEDLEEHEAELAQARTRVRLAQNAVAAELEIRRAVAAMSPETRRVISLRLGGEIKPTGGVVHEESPK